MGPTAGLEDEERRKALAHSGIRTQNRPARSDLQYTPRYTDFADKDIRSPFSKECTKRIDVCNIRISTIFFCSATQINFDAIRCIYNYSFVKSFPELEMFARHRITVYDVISISHKFSHSFVCPVRESSG